MSLVFFVFYFYFINFCFYYCFIHFFGASYELIIFYNKKKNNENDFDSDVSLSDFNGNGQDYISNEINNTRVNNSLNNFFQQNSIDDSQEKKCWNGYYIYILLFLLGIVLQPFFLVYKFLQTLMECYKKFGCWFFYMGNY